MIAWWPLDDPAGSNTVVDIGLPPPNNGVPQPGPIVVSPPGGPLTVPGNLVTNPPDTALFFYSPATYVEVQDSSDLHLANSNLTIDGWIGQLPGPWSASAVNDLFVYTVVDKLNLLNNTGYAFYVEVQTSCSGCNPPPSAGVTSTTEMNLVFVLGDGTSLTFYRNNGLDTPLVYQGTGKVFPYPTPPDPLGPQQPPRWLHVAVKVDRALTPPFLQFYVSGNPLPHSQILNPVAAGNNTDPVWLGATRLYGTSHAPGFTEFTLNEIEIFNVPLADSDILSIAAAPRGKCTPTATPTPTGTKLQPPTPTPTQPPIATPTASPTNTAIATKTPTVTPTPTRTPSATPTVTPTPGRTPTPTPTCGIEPHSVIISTGSQVWSLVAAPAPLVPGPAKVIASNAAWTTLPNTQWISANAGCTDTTTTDCPGGLYSYQLCWDQCGPLASSPLLQVLADNTATVSLDGNLLTTLPATIGFTTPATILGFTPGSGLHTLQVDVYNNPYSGGGGTATGMDLSGTLNGSVRIVPCPCIGDCNGDGQVTINELLTMVNIALGLAPCSDCIGVHCPVTIDQILAAVSNALNGCSNSNPTATATPTPCTGFVDNGDGTITDCTTHLMWEKKDQAGGLHDYSTAYSWAGQCSDNSLCQPNAAAAGACNAASPGALGCSTCSVGSCNVDPGGYGATTTIWDWLVQLNGSNFAGHSDWHIPTVGQDGGAAQLETILAAPYPCFIVQGLPCVPAVFNMGCAPLCSVTGCSCTAWHIYWSATTVAASPENAWDVAFFNADTDSDTKDNGGYNVRAVR